MTRKGKIARLPRDIRDELNERLDNGEAGEPLLHWLNELPEVQSVLANQFAGVAISKQNLSEWRTGGFAEWQTRQEILSDAGELAADAAELEEATDGRLSDHLATVVGARYASALAGWDGQPTEEFRQKLKVLRSLCRDIAELRRGDHSGARLQQERERVEETRERTEEELIEHFETWAKRPAIRDWLCQGWVSPQERDRRKRALFGLPPKPEQREAQAQTGVPSVQPQPGNADQAPADPANVPPGAAAESHPEAAESSQVKPSQTKNGSLPGEPPAQPNFSQGHPVNDPFCENDT